MNASKNDVSIVKLKTGIPGFDFLSNGGLPKGRTTLVAGTSGSAKTIFAAQFLAEGVLRSNESGVFVTFEESPSDIRKNMLGLGWDIAKWEKEGKWAFVDASPTVSHEAVEVGSFDLGALIARIEHAVKKVGAERVSMDSLGAIFTQLTTSSIVRSELFRISVVLKSMSVTSVMTVERTQEYGEISRYGVEEFVADNVIILRNALEEEKRRRTMEILKFRGTNHQKGEFPFSVVPNEGIIVIPLSAIELKHKSSPLRITSGSNELDKMCGGGFFRDSIILVSGATGCGKTLITTEFIAGGTKVGEKCLLFAFEESREQLFRNATGWGHDFEQMEKDEKFKVICTYPEVSSLEEHLIRMKDVIGKFKPNRVAIDSLSALERISTIKGFREFVIDLTSFIKHQELAGLFTATTPTLTGGSSVTEQHISTITDSIILLRYVEMFGEMRRGIMVLKMRGSAHDKEIREITIDNRGMHIGNSFAEVRGILSGNPVQISREDSRQMNMLFNEEE